ncbi:MAG: RHS repeat protein [Alphaproteobacteria bacterium]|nr:RHS repeat protein [Alphaproteobacteria bacterium]
MGCPDLRRAAALLLALALGSPSAQARPAPLLGPDGLTWIGAITPESPPAVRAGREQVLVDPETGRLWVEAVDVALEGRGPPLGVRRVHDDTGWRWSALETVAPSRDGVLWRGVDADMWLAPDQPLPPGDAEAPRPDGLELWPEGSTFGGGALVRAANGWTLDTGSGERRFDDLGRLTFVGDVDGDALQLKLTDEGLAAITDGGGRQLQVQRDGRGRPSVVNGPGGLTLYYDHQGDVLESVSGTDRARTRYLYDDQGRLSVILWADGSRLRVRRDDAGRVIEIAGPGIAQLRVDWTEAGPSWTDGAGRQWSARVTGAQVRVQSPGGRVVTSSLEGGRLAGWTDPAGGQVRLIRDEAGQIVRIEAPGGQLWRLSWGATGLRSLTDPAGGSWRWERDRAGRPTHLTDPDGHPRAFRWDVHGQLVELARGSARPWRLERDLQGRVISLIAPGGAVTRLRRDARGRVTAVVDPAGNEILLSGWRRDMPTTLLSRTGARWSFGVDAMGRLDRLETPYDVPILLRRDATGRLTRLGAADPGPAQRLIWRADGSLVRLEDVDGGAWGVVQDAAGRPIRVLRPDGTAAELSWDARGTLVGLSSEGASVRVTRNARDLPLSMGPLTWAWDLAGRLVEATASALRVALTRNLSGQVVSVQVGEEPPIPVGWDAGLRAVTLGEGAQRVELGRDPSGLVVQLRHPSQPLILVDRDERGLVARIHEGGRVRRALRDAEGDVLKWVAPDGRAMSSDRGLNGEPRLVRFTDGSMTLRAWGPDEWTVLVEDPGGRVVLDRRVGLDALGQPELLDEGQVQRIHRDVQGRVVAIEGPDGAWTASPDRRGGPDGSEARLDEQGRPREAIPPVGPAAWGVAVDALEYLLDPQGRVETVIGELGSVRVAYDALGRPTALDGGDAGARRVTWDVLGRPIRVEGSDGAATDLSWGLDGLLSWTEDGARVDVLHEPGWGWSLLGRGATTVHVDETGSPRLVFEDGEAQPLLGWTPSGAPVEAADFPLAWAGLLALWPGGPLLDGLGAWDPVSGAPLSPRWRPPLSLVPPETGPRWPQLDTAARPWWDPAPWVETGSIWSDPLAILVSLGELDGGGEGRPLRPEPPPLPWLPDAAATPEPPLGAGWTGVVLDAHPVVAAALAAGLHGGHPVREQDLFDALLQQEMQGVTAAPWVPLGWPAALTSPDPLGRSSYKYP